MEEFVHQYLFILRQFFTVPISLIFSYFHN